MNRIYISALAASLLAMATPGFAADLVTNTPPKAVPPALNTTTLSFEAGPTFSQKAGSTFNQLSNTQWTAGITYVLAPNWTVNATLKDQIKNDPAGGTDSFYQPQVTIGYRAKLNDTLAVTVSGGIGIALGNTGYAHGVANLAGDDTFLYYLGGVGLDVKLDPHWTWNAINVQYKNAFSVDYLTPFASTGLTYAVDSHSAVYGKATYNWSDYGLGSKALAPLSAVAVIGYKYSF